jgi:flagellar biosynthetic protein FliQ
MNEADALDLVQFAIWTVLVASAPAVLMAMVVGVGIALVQALTQIQEITLTFVPKIVVTGIVLVIAGPWMLDRITAYTSQLFVEIPQLVGP